MKIRFLLHGLFCGSLMFGAGGCAGSQNGSMNSHVLPERNDQTGESEKTSTVVYFSATGTTKAAAQKIAEKTGANLIELEPETPYTKEDLDYNNPDSRTSIESGEDGSVDVPLREMPDVSGYERIYLGYPIWWDKAPKVVETFVSHADLENAQIVPFCTSGGSSIDDSVKQLQSLTDAQFLEGQRIVNDADIDTLIARANQN